MKKYNEFLEEDLNNVLLDPSPDSEREAKRRGLKHTGFGKYENKKGESTHVHLNNRLVSKDKASKSNSFQNTDMTSQSLIKTAAKEMKQVHSALLSAYIPDVYTSEELDSIRTYTDNAYVDLNKELGAIENSENDEVIVHTENIDNALEKGKAPLDFHAYVCMDTMDKLRKGLKIKTNGFQALTINLEVVLQQAQGLKNPIILQVLIPMGSKGMYIDDYSVNQDENEFLLPRGSKIQILEGPKKIDADDVQIMFYDCSLVDK